MMHPDGSMGGWWMGGMGIVWLLAVVLLVLGIVALVKYLRSKIRTGRGRCPAELSASMRVGDDRRG
jgi:cytochrome c-type biogenesis protein CcmH/NrfF